MLVPPDNFGLVEPGIYRCTKLDSDNFPFLETLKLKSLIVLDAEKPPRLLNNFIESNNIELFNLGGLKISNHHHNRSRSNSRKDGEEDKKSSNVSNSPLEPLEDKNTIEIINLKHNKNDQWMLIEKNLILRAFELLLNKSKHNLLLIDSTSTLVGILRKIQKWNFNSILNEYRIYTGNSSKSNYYAENFLELIQTELIPYEVDQANFQSKLVKQQYEPEKTHLLLLLLINSERNSDRSDSNRNSVESLHRKERSSDSLHSRRGSFRVSRNNSIDKDIQWDDVDSDDDMDDEMLSASPQIPANLLKLVERRKHEKSRDVDSDTEVTPGSSPKVDAYGRPNSFTGELFLNAARANLDKRRSSIDSKITRVNNSKFRNQNSPVNHFTQRASFEGTSPVFKKIKEREAVKLMTNSEIDVIKQNFDYKYYKNLNKYPVDFENVSVVKLNLPANNKLPDWFIRGRNIWEENFKKLNPNL